MVRLLLQVLEVFAFPQWLRETITTLYNA